MNRRRLKYLWFSLLPCLIAACMPAAAEQVGSGNTAYTAGDYAAALTVYEPMMVSQPESALFHYNGALALAGLNRSTHAEIALQRALDHADNLDLRADIYYNLGNLYYMQARYAEAMEVYRNTLLLRPGDFNAQYNLELALLRRGESAPTPTDEATPPPDVPPSVTPTPSATATGQNQPSGDEGSTPTPAPTATPSPQPGGETGEATTTPTLAPTVTPSPQPNPGQPDSGNPSAPPLAESESGELDEDDVNRLLDAIMQEQDTLDLNIQPTPQEGIPSNDW